MPEKRGMAFIGFLRGKAVLYTWLQKKFAAQSCATTLHAGSTQLSDGAVQLSDGTAQLADGLDALKQTLNADVLPLLNGDVQKALDVFENTKNQLAAEVSFDLIDDGMAHDMVYIIRTDLNK